VVRYDRRGHGKSAYRPAPIRWNVSGRDVLAILDDLNIKKVHLVRPVDGRHGRTVAWRQRTRSLRPDYSLQHRCHYPRSDNWLNRIKAVKEGGIASVADAVIANCLTADFRERERR